MHDSSLQCAMQNKQGTRYTGRRDKRDATSDKGQNT